ncbi:MAG TPA: amidohydrolase family protein [Pyrinomonadaceae bacterium]|jgi:hypothetical protein
MLIDAHVHVTEDGKWFGTRHDASVERLLREMDEAGVTRSVLLPIAGTIANERVADLCRRHPGRFIGFGSVEAGRGATAEGIRAEVARVRALGLSGLKVHPRMQGVAPDSATADAILSGAAEAGLPVVFCGYQQCVSPEVSLDELAPYNYDRLAKRHPGATIVIAHMGGHRALDAYYVAKSNPNVYLDASFVFSALRETSVYRDLLFILRHLDRRVIFGSDFPEVSPAAYARQVLGEMARFEDCDAEAVCSGNLLSILPEGHA